MHSQTADRLSRARNRKRSWKVRGPSIAQDSAAVSNCRVARRIKVRMMISPFGDDFVRFRRFAAVRRSTSSPRLKHLHDQGCFRMSSAAAGRRPSFARKCPDQTREPPLVND